MRQSSGESPTLATIVEVQLQSGFAEGARQQRGCAPLAELTTQAEGVADQQVGVEPGAAGIDAPAAVDGDAAALDAVPVRARLVAVAEAGVAAAEVGVALARRGMGETLGNGDRIRQQQCLPERVDLAEGGQGLAVAQMGVDIQDPDLAAEEGRRLGAAEDAFEPAAVGRGPVHEPRAVGMQEMRADEAEMMLRLLG